MREIFESHPVAVLKKEIAKTNIKGYSTMKKAEVVELMLKNKARFSHIKMAEKKPRAKRGEKSAKSQPSQKSTASGGKEKKKESPKKKEDDPFAGLEKDAPKKKEDKPKGKAPARPRAKTPDFVKEIREEEKEKAKKEAESRVFTPKRLTKEEQFKRDRRNVRFFQPVYFKRLDSLLETIFSNRTTGVPAIDKLTKGDPDYNILDKMDRSVLKLKSKTAKGFGGQPNFNNEDKIKIMRMIDRINERYGIEVEAGKRGLKKALRKK